VDAFGNVAAVAGYGELVADRDPLEHEHAVLVHDLAHRLDLVELRIDLYPTRLQRAREGASQSAAGRGDDVVERRRVGREVVGIDAVVPGDLGVHAEGDGLILGRQVRQTLRAPESLDPNA
jgi:hypothetical protein